MVPIVYLTGDATHPVIIGNKIIAHICNDIGKWGSGFVLAVSRLDPRPERCYREAYGSGLALGWTQLVTVNADVWVANMIAQHGVASRTNRHPLDLGALQRCLATVAHYARASKATVHMPRIGCGLAGGKWEEVEPLITAELCERNVQVYVYDLDSK